MTDTPDTPDTPTSKKRVRRRQGQPLNDRIATMDTFIDAFSNYPNIRLACRAAGIHRSTYYEWLRLNPDGFADRLRDANEDANDSLDALVEQRARVSDVMLIFLAKSRMPRKYRDHWEADGPPPPWANAQANAQATVFTIVVGDRGSRIEDVTEPALLAEAVEAIEAELADESDG